MNVQIMSDKEIWLSELLFSLLTTFPRNSEWTNIFNHVISDIKTDSTTSEDIEKLLGRTNPMEPVCLETLESMVKNEYFAKPVFGSVRRYYGDCDDGGMPVRLLLVSKNAKKDYGLMLTAMLGDNCSDTDCIFTKTFKMTFEKAYRDATDIETKGLFRVTRYCSIELLWNNECLANACIDGESAYLSFLISILAHNKGYRLPTLVAFSGGLPTKSGRISKVGHIAEKCKVAYKRGIRYVFVHEHNIEELESVEDIPKVIKYNIGTPEEVQRQIFQNMDQEIVPYESYLSASHLAFTQLKKEREKALKRITALSKDILDRKSMDTVFEEAKALNRELTRRGIEDIEFEIEYHLLVCDYYNHKGYGQDAPESKSSYKFLEKNRDNYPEPYARAVNKRAVGYHDVFCPEEAEKQIKNVLEGADKTSLSSITIGKICGTRGQGFAFMKNHDLAEQHLKKSQAILGEGEEKDKKRTLNYLLHLAADTNDTKLWKEILDEDICMGTFCPSLNVSIYDLHVIIKAAYVFGNLEEKKQLSDILLREDYWCSEDETYQATVEQLAGLLNISLYNDTQDEQYKTQAISFLEKAGKTFSTCEGLLNACLYISVNGYLALLMESEEMAEEAIKQLRKIVTDKYNLKLRSVEFTSSDIWNTIKEICSSSYEDIPFLKRIECYTDIIRVFQWW